jgi:hypothetical protein
MRKAIIYKILNLENNHCYIGSTTDFKERVRRHWRDLRKNNHHSVYLQRAYNKYKKDCFVFQIIEEFEFVSSEHLAEKELFYIHQVDPEYNMKHVEYNALRDCKRVAWNKGIKCPPSIETSKTRSNNIKNLWLDDDFKNKVKEGSKKLCKKVYKIDINNNFISEFESTKKCADSLEISINVVNKFVSYKYTNKKVKEFSYVLSYSSNETIQSYSQKKKEKTKPVVRKTKPVYQYDLDDNFIKKWDSTKQIYDSLNYNISTINKCCTGEYRNAYNFKWKYE